MVEFRNESDLEFEDISSEECRYYRFQNEETVTIFRPQKLHVSNRGGHRIFDGAGFCHYVPAGWIHLSWTAKEDAPHFVK